MRRWMIVLLCGCVTLASAYTPGSSDGRMGGVRNSRSGVCENGPQSFPLSTQLVRSAASIVGMPIVSGDRIFFFSNAIRCFDVLTGNLLWSYWTSANGGGTFYTRSMAVDDERVYFSTKNSGGIGPGAVFALDARTGAHQWSFTNRAGGYSCTAPLVQDGRVYFSGNVDKLRAVHADTGEIIWETPEVVGSTDYGGMAMEDGRLFLFTQDRYLRAFSASNGAALWSAYIPERPVWAESWPVVSSGLVYLAINESSSGLYVFSATNGALLRIHSNRYYSKFMSPAVAGGIYYIAGCPATNTSNLSLMAFDGLGNGAPLWSVPLTTNAGGFYDSPVVANGVVYFHGPNLLALDADTGAVQWSTTGLTYNAASPFARYGRLFVAGYNTLYIYSDGSSWPTENQSPGIQLPGPHILPVGVSTSFAVTATDPDNDSVLLTNAAAPALAGFSGGWFSWTAPSSLAGTTQQVVFCANDQRGATNSIVTNRTQLIVPFDSDADEMSDGWEWDYFQTLACAPDADADEDGADNLHECIAGTHPSNTASRFTLAAQDADNAACRIRVDAVNGRQYTIQFSDILPTETAHWHPFANPANGAGTWTETNPAGSTFFFRDDESPATSGGPMTNGVRYYRVGVRKP